MGGRATRAARAAVARELASVQGGVVHRAALRSRGVSRADVRSEVAAGRWTALGRHTVLVGTPPVSEQARLWQAVWESGGGAALDGVAALCAAGLTGFH